MSSQFLQNNTKTVWDDDIKMFKRITPYSLIPKTMLNCQQQHALKNTISCTPSLMASGGTITSGSSTGSNNGSGAGVGDDVLLLIQNLQSQINNLNETINNLTLIINNLDEDHPHPAFIKEQLTINDSLIN